MNSSRFLPSLDRDSWLRVAGGAGAVVVAIALYTRYNIDGALTRDEGIYTYGGQQLAHHGVPPYASVVDPKGPLATLLCGLGAAIARLFGRDDVLVIRALYLLCSLLTVLMIYVLVTRLWKSVFAGVAAAVVFVSFEGYARAALVGPDAKVPGLLAAVIAMWLAARRQWLWAGVAAGFTVLDWQPLLAFPAFVVLAAFLAVPEQRWRNAGLAVAGVAAPILASIVYFAAAGALGKYYESALEFPLTGVKRTNETVGRRVHVIVNVIHRYYGFSGVLFWIGLVLLLAVAVVTALRDRWPAVRSDTLLIVIVPSLLFEAVYALTDFQNYPDVYPLLIFPAIGFGGAVALVARELRDPRQLRVAAAAVLAAALALTAVSWSWFSDSPANNTGLVVQRAYGCALNRMVLPGTSLYSLGNPVVLVVTHRRNPDRYVFLNSGVDAWKVHHTAGGFDGWVHQIQASKPSVLVLDGWSGKYRMRMHDALDALGYQRGYVGQWRVFVSPAAQANMPSAGVALTPRPTKWPKTDAGTDFKATRGCRAR